jgi:riboflavin kinase/FMN adenylyltransferase
MKIVSAKGDFKRIKKGCVLTIGNFDGVHVGHQEILKAAINLAQNKTTDMVVMTFEPHPVAVLHPEKAPGVLSPLPLKLYLLRRYTHASCILVIESDKQLLAMSPEDFVGELLAQQLQPSVIVEGDDFHFGAKREGDVEDLKNLGGRMGFEVEVVPARQIALGTGQLIRVSSTIIRYMIESGHVCDATVALSRPYRLMGRIISGRGRGRQLGFPTVNMQRPEQIIPAEGVYAGFSETADSEQELLKKTEKIPAVFSIGQARTFGDEHPLLIEAHFLINDVGDMVNKWLTMDFVQLLRSQHKFNTPQELALQIAKDCQAARGVLKDALPESGSCLL